MSEYDFRNLSDYDFEILLRDLLSEHLGVYFQGFKRGRDGGVDLRYSDTASGDIIVQCKHYLRTPLEKLIKEVSVEKSKLDKIKLSRYILATSLELSDGNKASIMTVLDPYCLSKKDIYSNQDINYLLSIYPRVEQRHPKLWLSSSAVLDKFINNDIISRTKILFEEISEDAAKYVQNASFDEARDIISNLNYCVISGIPGIGKTTLAKMLLLNYSMEGYEPVYVSEDIEEAYRLMNPDVKQVIYYDDFLGKTKFSPASLNFEKRLLGFIKAVKRSKNTVFILTTREYILSQAIRHYEDLELNREILDNGKCIINLNDYTRGQKALILYNHLYHSAIDKEDLNSLMTNRNVHRIIAHRNYLPRVIDWVIKNKKISKGDNLAEKLLLALSNPREIWKSAYERHISQSAKAVLILLFSFGETGVDLLKQDYITYTDYLIKIGKLHASEINFEDSLRELEGSFVQINQHRHVDFHNPSIIDYLEDHFRGNPHEIYPAIEFMQDQRLLWKMLLRTYRPYGVSAEPMRHILLDQRAIEKIQEAGDRLVDQLVDNMPIDSQKFHIENLKYSAKISKNLNDSNPIRRLFTDYIENILSKTNLLIDTHLDSIETLASLSHLYEESDIVKKAIDTFLKRITPSTLDLSVLEDILSLTRGINLSSELKGDIESALDREIRKAAKTVVDSYSSSNLERFQEMHAVWEDLGFSDEDVQDALEVTYINQAQIEEGEVQDEDYEEEPDEDYDREPSHTSFAEDVVNYDDVIDLIESLNSDEN